MEHLRGQWRSERIGALHRGSGCALHVCVRVPPCACVCVTGWHVRRGVRVRARVCVHPCACVRGVRVCTVRVPTVCVCERVCTCAPAAPVRTDVGARVVCHCASARVCTRACSRWCACVHACVCVQMGVRFLCATSVWVGTIVCRQGSVRLDHHGWVLVGGLGREGKAEYGSNGAYTYLGTSSVISGWDDGSVMRE